EFSDQHSHRPSVRDDVVHTQQKDMILLCQTQEGGAEQRSSLQVERTLSLFGHRTTSRSPPILGRQTLPILHGKDHLCCVSNHLYRLVLMQREGRPQHLVTTHDLAQALLQRCLVQSASQPQCARNVVEAAARLQLIQEPQTLLSKRQRQRSLSW